MNALIWPMLFLAFGVILLIAEVFIPSGGMIGLLALGLVGLSLFRAFAVSTAAGMQFLAAVLILLPAALVLAAHLWPKTPLARRIFLSPPRPDEVAPSHRADRLDHLVGQFGRALTPLRPSGLVDFDGRRLDGLSEEGLIPAGALVRAVQVRSGQLVVRRAQDPALNELMT